MSSYVEDPEALNTLADKVIALLKDRKAPLNIQLHDINTAHDLEQALLRKGVAAQVVRGLVGSTADKRISLNAAIFVRVKPPKPPKPWRTKSVLTKAQQRLLVRMYHSGPYAHHLANELGSTRAVLMRLVREGYVQSEKRRGSPTNISIGRLTAVGRCEAKELIERT